ncbi:histidine ammonia-lyase, partial [bacterium]|nr:histidine ammonia-lyase [bacterium]
DNVENIIAMEFLSATQALDLLKPNKPGSTVLKAYDVIRKEVPFAKEDRVFAKDVEKIRLLMKDGSLMKAITSTVGELEW